MQFEKDPTDNYKHAITFESDEGEVEAVVAVYREVVNTKAEIGKIEDIEEGERRFCEWDIYEDQTMFTDSPLRVATRLKNFHIWTEEAIEKMLEEGIGPAFDSDVIARRIRLGEKALIMAELIQLEYDNDSLQLMLEEGEAEMFRNPQTRENS